MSQIMIWACMVEEEFFLITGKNACVPLELVFQVER
jgi:hypothetical protein